MNKRLNTILLILAAFIGIAIPAAASYLPFNTNVNMNVGIGTTTPEGALTVMNGNVGIGTWVPGYALQVQGVGEFTKAVYATNILTGASGFTLNVSGGGVSGGGQINFVGGSAPVAPGTIQFLTGTATGVEPEHMRIDANGNVGIGSWGQNNLVNTFTVVGNIGIGTNQSSPFVQTSAPNGGMIVQSNVGIGTLTPGQALDVNGTVRMTGVTLTGNGAANGNVLVGNSVGAGTWMPASTLAIAAATNYWNYNTAGNIGVSTIQAVGIGTTFVGGSGEGALSVMNGNVGIGTWVPANSLDVVGGNIGIGTTFSIKAGINNILTLRSDITSVYLGLQAGASTTAGNLYNSALGDQALYSNTNGYGNTAVGATALYSDNSGQNNTAVGQNALYYNTSGFQNIALGYLAGEYITGGSVANITSFDSVYLGSNTMAQASGDNNEIVIGFNVTGAGNNTVTLGNSSIVTTLLNGNVGIGSVNPGQILDAQGTIRMKGLILTGNGAANGNVLVSNSVGVGTWMAASTLATAAPGTNYWFNDTGNVGIGTIYNVGIGTISQVNTLNVLGNIGIGTYSYDPYMKTAASSGGIIMSGNLGIGTWTPLGALQISNMWTFDNGGYKTIYYNGYDVAGNDIYATTNPASRMAFTSSGQIIFQVAGSGSAGSSINWADGMKVANTGNVGIGGTGLSNSPDAGSLFSVRGGASIGLDYFSIAAPPNGLEVEGNVGVGTTVPISPIEINKENLAAVSTDGFVLSNYTASTAGTPGQYSPRIRFHSSEYSTSNHTIDWIIEPENATNDSELTLGVSVDGGGFDPVAQFDMYGNSEFENIETFGSATFTPNFSTVVPLTVEGSGGQTANLTDWENSTPNILDVINANGNLGIGSATPGQLLDVQGTIRIKGFILTGNGAANGYVLVGNSVGVGTWMPASSLIASGGSNFWLNNNGGNVGISTAYAVGIGTTFVGGTGEASFAVMNGNVGIGTWVPAALLDIGNVNQGEVQIGDGMVGVSNELAIGGLGDGIFFAGSNGFGTISGSGATNPFYLSLGTDANSNLLVLSKNNVGIGTINPQGGLTVMTGNVGIGTWAPIVPLQIVGIGTQAPYGGGVIINNGNVGIGTTVPSSALYVGSGVITSYNTLAGSGEGIVTYAGNGKAINMQAGTANANILYDSTGGFSFQSEARGSVIAGLSSSANITMNIDTNGNVGIGTISSVLGGLIVQNGDVGFGTFFPQTGLAVMNGNVGIGTWTAKGGNLIINGGGNVGIGSAWPGTMLDVQGTIRSLGQIVNGNVTVASGGQFSGRITRRLVVVTQSATPSINTDTMDIASITGLAQAITSMSSGLTGTPNNGDMLMVQITDNGTARGITWGASFASTTVYTLPSTTVASTLLRVLLQYNSVTGHWECIGVD